MLASLARRSDLYAQKEAMESQEYEYAMEARENAFKALDKMVSGHTAAERWRGEYEAEVIAHETEAEAWLRVAEAWEDTERAWDRVAKIAQRDNP